MEGWHDCGRWKSRENFIQREMGEVVGGGNVGLQECGEGKRLAFVFGLFQPLSRPLKDGMNEAPQKLNKSRSLDREPTYGPNAKTKSTNGGSRLGRSGAVGWNGDGQGVRNEGQRFQGFQSAGKAVRLLAWSGVPGLSFFEKRGSQSREQRTMARCQILQGEIGNHWGSEKGVRLGDGRGCGVISVPTCQARKAETDKWGTVSVSTWTEPTAVGGAPS